ncbi:hypothetical protein D3P09_23695 [Paenibacillus pinisoli]|uniref:Uncharacterized protein n=1 Tax=Paenibacillus pinisoli TaxID=1276110 RepID=A0A3A6PAM9_9BACL|nr:hypothetical protein [Paenibacillus pinisoli]RJX37357.1 hypothetical protein D3P09_23695 [Paenibacillus pinisoli]
MLTFDQKLAIIASFPELQRKDVSLGRVNFHYEESVHEKKTVVYHLHPNGNGFVYGGLIDGVETDAKGLVNIRDYGEEELQSLIARSIASLSAGEASDSGAVQTDEETGYRTSRAEFWRGAGGTRLTLLFQEDLWFVYAGKELDMAFETYEEATQYLVDEGFRRE